MSDNALLDFIRSRGMDRHPHEGQLSVADGTVYLPKTKGDFADTKAKMVVANRAGVLQFLH